MNEIALVVIAVVLIAAASPACGPSDKPDRTPVPSTTEGDASASTPPAAKTDAPATQPQAVSGLPAGWALAPRTKIRGRQADGVVTITASGENPTGGYENKLFQSPLRIWPPQFILARKKPDGMATQAITPYEATASFKADRKVATIVVHDASGRGIVNVAQGRQ